MLRGRPREVRGLRALLEVSVRRRLHVDHGQDAQRHGRAKPIMKSIEHFNILDKSYNGRRILHSILHYSILCYKIA